MNISKQDLIGTRRAGALARYAAWQERWREPILTALLALLASEIFINIPLARAYSPVSSVLAVVWLLLIVATALIATRKRVAMVAMLGSSTLALGANMLRLSEPSTWTLCIGAASCAVFMMLLCWVVWGAVYGPGPVTYHRVRGAVVIYLSVALAFAALYELLITLSPGAITPITSQDHYLVVARNLMYYSLTTLTSVGYGDLLPVHPLARTLSSLESVIGQLFPATFVARIIALETHARRNGSAG